MILDDIISHRRASLQHAHAIPQRVLRTMIAAQPPARSLSAALRSGGVRVIAEIKRASPVKGTLRDPLDPREFAQAYEAQGAAAISVLTEPHFFKGSFLDLRHARLASSLPVLCKDFILDSSQILEARAHQADAILLIAAALDDHELRHLLSTATSVGLEALVEVHNREEAQRALDVGASLIGVNNRNLHNFTVDLHTTEALVGYLPRNVTVVSESGIRTAEDVKRIGAWGVHAILVGESIVSAANPAAKLHELVEAGRYSYVAR